MKINVVAISDMMVTNDIDETLITYSLGVSLGVLIYELVARVSGLLHSILPLSKMDSQKAIRFPYILLIRVFVFFLEKLLNLVQKKTSAYFSRWMIFFNE